MVHSAPMEQTTKNDLTVYELSYHITRALSESESEVLLQSLRDAVVKAGGSFLAEGALEEVDLAYPIQKHEKALFGWMKFETTPEAVKNLQEDVLKNQKNIIRYALIKTVREDTRASAQARIPQSASGLVQEVETKGTLERKTTTEESANEEVSEEEIDEALDELTDEK